MVSNKEMHRIRGVCLELFVSIFYLKALFWYPAGTIDCVIKIKNPAIKQRIYFCISGQKIKGNIYNKSIMVILLKGNEIFMSKQAQIYGEQAIV